MSIALSLFSVSLVAMIGLFFLKMWEAKRGAEILPRARRALDIGALWCKARLTHLEEVFSRIPPRMVILMRFLLAASMRGFAGGAHRVAEMAHRLADFVSHKHRFERRETRSELLKRLHENRVEKSSEVTTTSL